MSSPLFRWTFETPKKTDSEETFYEEAEENGMNERNFQNEDMDTEASSQFPMLRNFYSSDRLDNEELSQGLVSPLVPVARNNFPSRDLTSSNPNHAVRNNTGVSKFNNKQKCLDLVGQNSQSCKWIAGKSQTDAFRHRKKWTDSSAETFFGGEDKFRAEDRRCVKNRSQSLLRCASHENICDDEVVAEMSPEILTGLDDFQFNAYPTERECTSQAASTDAKMFFEEKNVKQIQVENCHQQRSSSHENTCNNQVDFEMSPEILTGLGDSQFNAYPKELESQEASTDVTFFEEKNVREIDVKNCSQLLYDSPKNSRNASEHSAMLPEALTDFDDSQFNAYPIKSESQALSTDATYFDVSEKQNEAFAVENPASHKGKLCVDSITKHAAELHKTFSDNLSFERVPLNQNERILTFDDSTANAELGACLNTDLSQGMVEFIENVAAYPLLDISNLRKFMETITITDSSDHDDLSVILDETLEDIDQLHLSPAKTSSPKESRQTSGNHHVAKKQKRVASPQNFGDNKKRKMTETKYAQNLRPMGKPSLSRIKLGMRTPSREPRTPCHPMSLRLRKGRCAESSPKCCTPDCLSEEKSSRKKKSNYFELDSVNTNSWGKKNVNSTKSNFSSHASTPQISSSKSVKNKITSQRKKNSSSDSDYVGANPGRKREENLPRSSRKNTQTPPFDVSLRRQGKTTPKPQLSVTFEDSPFNQKGGKGRPRKIVQSDFKITPKPPLRATFEESPVNLKGGKGRPKKTVQSDFKDFVPGGDNKADSQSRLSTGKRCLRRPSQPVGKFIAVQSGKLSRGRPSASRAENSVNKPLVLLHQDETCLRSMRQRLLDIIFDEIPLSMDEAENMRCEIKEKQQRIDKWNHPGVEDKVCRLVKELETLCENMLYQIQSLMDSSRISGNGDLPVPKSNHSVYQRNDTLSPSRYTEQELQNVSGWRSQTKTKVGSKKSNLRGIVANLRRKVETPVRQKMPAEPNLKRFVSSGGNRHLPSPPGNFVSPRCNILPASQSPEQRPKSLQERNFLTEKKVILKTPKLDGTVANIRGRRKVTPAKDAVNARHSKRPEYSRVLMDHVRSLTGMDKACRVESPKRPPVKLVSSQDLREDTLAEQTLSCITGKEVPYAECLTTNICESVFVCGVCSKKTVVDIGTNTDFVEPRQKIKEIVFVDRSTYTDPEDFDRRCKRKELVEIGTNTESNFSGNPNLNLMVGRRVLNSVTGIGNKENIGTKLDLKHVTRVWLPRPEDFLPCSYDYLTPEYLANNPNAEIPQELLDDLTWED